MAYVKTSQGAYPAGGSLSKNKTEEVDVSVAQDGSEMETRYYITLHASVEIAFDTGLEKASQSVVVRLKDPDDLSKDYRLSMWDVPTYSRALAQGALDADTQLKILYGTGDPVHGTAITTIT